MTTMRLTKPGPAFVVAYAETASAGRVLSADDGDRFVPETAPDMCYGYAGTPAVTLRECVIRVATESTADRRPGTNAFHCIVQPACPASTVTVCASGICSATQRWCRGGMTPTPIDGNTMNATRANSDAPRPRCWAPCVCSPWPSPREASGRVRIRKPVERRRSCRPR
jgi:hypothetical protein